MSQPGMTSSGANPVTVPNLQASDIHDLRSALELLRQYPAELFRTTTAVDPDTELAAVYKRVGAGPVVPPPTRSGPAMLFESIKGYPDFQVAVGILASRRRAGLFLGCPPRLLAFRLLDALNHPLAPVDWTGTCAPCQEVVHRPPFDLRRLLPAPTNTSRDAGPYFCLGVVRAQDPQTGESDVTIHRLCVQGPDRLTIFFAPHRHIDVFRQKAEAAGQPLPVSISMGLDPAIYLAVSFEPPTTPLGLDELGLCGALRGRAVELVDCLSVPARALARAEVVLEGEILPGERLAEDVNTGTGLAMPELTGYHGRAHPSLPVIRVTAVTHRRNPILQTLVGPGLEHTVLVGLPTEASILALVNRSMPGTVKNVYCHPAGGGKYLAILQCAAKQSLSDEGCARQAALTAFAAFAELKHVVLVDEDVDLFNSDEVLWSLTTRYQGDASTLFLPGICCHPLDPSQSPEFSRSITAPGVTCKTIFDTTVPFGIRARFQRPEYAEVDLSRFLPADAVARIEEEACQG